VLLAAVAAFALPLAALAQAGAREWVVLDTRAGIAVFAGDPVRGPHNAREVDTLIVLAAPVAGLDIEISSWTVDCGAMTIVSHGGDGYLGDARVRDMPSHTPQGAEKVEPGRAKGKIAAYACSGERESGDDTRFASDADAIAYGRKIAAR
jgi:hypothetical protein